MNFPTRSLGPVQTSANVLTGIGRDFWRVFWMNFFLFLVKLLGISELFFQTSAASGFLFKHVAHCARSVFKFFKNTVHDLPQERKLSSHYCIFWCIFLLDWQFFKENWIFLRQILWKSSNVKTAGMTLHKSRQSTVSLNCSAKFHLFSLSKSLSEEMVSSEWFKVFHDSDFSSRLVESEVSIIPE